ncbi:MAG TPA: AAA family ATPase [Candidatus Saccharimonadia bacterium]|nr:AAA family ATPase [Candidatus Saccharimonadia bacterium]
MAYTLSTDQAAALKQIGAWYRAKSTPYLTLGGYAGTGKTTLIAYLRQALRQHDPEARVAFCAYTGKAARVLTERLREQKVPRKKDSVSTIHALIYEAADPLGALSGEAPSWMRKEVLERDLIIVDEASMVDEAIWRDLLSFKIPILAVGDHGQLPPVGSSFNLMAEPQIRLERIFRQTEDSPIIDVATLARTTGALPVREFGAGVRKLDRQLPETGLMVQELLESWRPDLLVLCGYNHTRVKLNAAMRGFRDIDSPEPQSGDQVVCLRNNRAKKIYNGMVGRVVRCVPVPADVDPQQLWYEAEIELDGEDYRYAGYVLRAQFGATEAAKDVPLAPDGQRGDLWDFGYAVTVHKAQGSQAQRVLLFEERFARSSDEDWRRWLYTAVTRAQEELTVIGPDPGEV